MPAQVEEIEAAEREGIVVRTGLAPVEVVQPRRRGRRHPLRARRGRPPATARRIAGGMGAGPRLRGPSSPATTILVAVGEEPDPSILPGGRRHRGQRLGRHRRRPAHAGHRPRRDLRRRRRRVRTRRPSSTPSRRDDARPRRSTSTCPGVTDGEGEILDDRPLRRPRRSGRSTLDLATRPRAHAPLPMVQPGSFAATQVGFDEATAPSRGRPLLPLRRGLRRPGRRRPRRSRSATSPAMPIATRTRSLDDIAGGTP